MNTGCERFHVYMRYQFYGPVAFVEPEVHPPHASPSSAVVVVRKYLDRQINRLPGSIRFESIGPSPFHADFFLKEGAVSDFMQPFRAACEHHLAYDSVMIESRLEGLLVNFEEIRDALFEAMEDELGFFYQLMRERSAQIHRWVELEASVRRAIAPDSTRHGWQKVKWLFTRRAKLKNLIHALLLFRADVAFFRGDLREQYRSQYESGKYQSFIKEFTDKTIANLYEYSVPESLEMVKFEHERATKFVEWTTAVLAAVAGGLVGAALTRMMGAGP